jgi:4-hydroxy 2-oxovalerate aldolase
MENMERYAENFSLWAEECVKVIDKESGREVPFRLNAPQRRVAALMEKQRRAGRPVRVIATSNVTNVKDTHFDYTLNYNSLIDQNAEIIDNSFVMLLNVLTKTSVHHAACAGFDGYTVDGDNYYNSAMDYRIAREKSQSINQYVIDTLERLAGTLTLEFLTDSKYVK